MLKLLSKKSKIEGEILIPASKSHTIRAVAIATMAHGTSTLRNPLISADALAAFKAAEEFGAEITVTPDNWVIKGTGGKISPSAKFIDVANSGTSLRIFSALSTLGSHNITFDGDSSIRKRPMTPLLTALRNLGATAITDDDKCPFTLSGPIHGGKTTVNGISSQFLTALLFTTPLSNSDTEILVENLHEKPYVEITLDWLRTQGIRFEQKGLDWFKIYGNQQYRAFDRKIPADFSSATFALLAAAVTQSEILIKGLDFKDHQGDKEVFSFMQKMGVKVKHTNEGVLVSGNGLKGIDIDMNDTPDALPALAVAACFAEGKTSLLNVKQARLKECDRIAASVTELRKMGANVEELPDGIIIHGSKLKAANLHGYHDHRMVMALGIAGMGCDGETIIDTAEAIDVTYPSFVDDMQALGATLKIIPE